MKLKYFQFMIKKNILFTITLFLNFNHSFAFEANSTDILPKENSFNSSGKLSEFTKNLAYNATYSLINTNLNKVFLKDASAVGLLKKIPYCMVVYMALNSGFYDSNFDANLLFLSLGMATVDNILCQRYVKGSFVQKLENKLKSALGFSKNAEVKYQDNQIVNLCSDVSWSAAWLLGKKAMGF